ncbi:MAG TPA: glycosyltransferase [Solirubrobacterales bacterium]|nr:glycosyltransferase [Solirubrobacterales bacterium]
MGSGGDHRDLDLSGAEQLRVLQVIGRLNMGGPAHIAALLSGKRFYPDRYETLLVHGTPAPGEASLADLAAEEGATMRFLPELRQPVQPLHDSRALLKLIRLMREFRPHVVHTHTAKAGFLGRQAALAVRPRPAIVHTYHGHVLEGYFGRAKARLYLEMERAMARVSDCLIGVSQATVDDLVRLGVAPRERFRVLPLGLDLDRFAELPGALRAESRGELGLDTEEVLLVFVGRLVPIKRLDVLLGAFARARESEPRLRLAVVGDGEERSRLEGQAAELGIAAGVRFLGYRRELHPIFAAADLALLSSDNEGTPVSLIEAAAAGLPAAATDVGGVREVVVEEETGMLVPPGDAAALAAAILRLAADAGLRERYGLAARRRAIERYGAERLLDDVDGLYRELVAARAATA